MVRRAAKTQPPAPRRQRARVLLTDAQWEVVRLLRTGRSNQVIADELGLTEATVKVHVRAIMRNLGLQNRTQIAIAAQDLVDPDQPRISTN